MSKVEVVRVTKRYGDVVALDSVDLTVESGQVLAVLGPSGCGKTTLLRCIAGFERIDDGRITLGGRVVALPGVHLPPHRRQVTVVPQDGALFPHLDVADNVGFGLARGRDRQRRVAECLELVGLGGLGERMPHELSGGQQQRVACARAIVARPEVIFADEPTGNLDSRAGAEVLGFLRSSVREMGQTIVMVTHDPVAASYADRVVFLRDGQIVSEIVRPTPSTVLDRLKSLEA